MVVVVGLVTYSVLWRDSMLVRSKATTTTAYIKCISVATL